MSKGVKILILVLTLLPIFLYFGAYFGIIAAAISGALSEVTRNAHSMPSPDDFPAGPMIAMFACITLAILTWLGMLIFYICNLIVTKKVPKDLRPVWGVLLVCGHMVAWVIYWVMYIWREPIAKPELTTSMIPPPYSPESPING